MISNYCVKILYSYVKVLCIPVKLLNNCVTTFYSWEWIPLA
jgi:hypothetical protein